jgi:hypothetical protein
VALLGTYGSGRFSDPGRHRRRGRAAALQTTGRTPLLLTAPNYFRLEEAGYKTLANLADHDARRPCIRSAGSRRLAEAGRGDHQGARRGDQALTTTRYAVKSYTAFDKQPAPMSRIYDLYKNGNIFDRVPHVSPAIKSIVAQQVDPRIAADLKAFDFHKIVDNATVARLVKEGYFEQLFGADVKAEEQRKAKIAF